MFLLSKNIGNNNEGLLGNLTKLRPNTKRPRRRPRQRWADRVKEDLKMVGMKMRRNFQGTGKSERTLLLRRRTLMVFKMPKKKKKAITITIVQIKII